MRARTAVALAVAVTIGLAGCGGSDGATGEGRQDVAAAKSAEPGSAPGLPDIDDLIAITPAYSGIATGCLSPDVDEALLSEHADTLIAEFAEAGADIVERPFKLTPSAPNVTLSKLMNNSAEQLRNCDQAGKATRGNEIADRMDAAAGG